jgi:RNA polymerase sigma factor (TIGR02999 family)
MMSLHSQSTVATLLVQLRDGDSSALRQLFPLVYDQVLQLARTQRRRLAKSETLNTTALVHEAFIKLVGQERLEFRDRAHFMAVAATAMRHLLIDHARRKRALKRGGDAREVTFKTIEAALESGAGFSDDRADALLALDRALVRLEKHSERQSRLVECRFFAGMSIEETAEALGISPATVKRDWVLAQAWLYRELREALE